MTGIAPPHPPRVGRAAGGLGLLLLAATVGAQPASVPFGKAWTADLFLQGGWDSNIDFSLRTNLPGERSAFVARASGSLAYDLNRPRAQVSFSLAGGTSVYSALSELSQFDARLGLKATLQATPRLSIDVQDTFSYAYGRDQLDLVSEGVLLPLVLTRFNLGRLGLSRRLSRRVSVSGSAEHTWVSQPGEGGYEETRLVANAALSWEVGRAQHLRTNYTFRASGGDAGAGRAGQVHSGQLGFDFPLGKHTTMDLAGGGDYSPETGQGVTPWTPNGAARLSSQTERGQISAEYSHFVGQTIGFSARSDVDLARLSYSYRLSRRLSTSLAGSYRRTAAKPSALGSYALTLALQRTLGRRLRMRIGYSFEESSGGGLAASTAHRVSLSLGEVWLWR